MSIGTQQQPLKMPFQGHVDRKARSGPGAVVRTLAFCRRYPGFMIVVVLPTLLAIAYYGFIQANLYQSNAQFLIKEANQNSTLSGLGSFLQSTGIASTSNDAATVDAYLVSRDALGALEQSPGIRAIYARPEADFVNRFPNLLFGPSFENLFGHYTSWTTVNLDSSSNITTLTVTAFRPGDARALAERLLTLGEDEVNRLNDRVRDNALQGARREVAQLQSRLAAIQGRITAFRGREQILDPNETSTQSVTLLSSLESTLVSARAALAQQQATAPNSPQIPALRARVTALEGQVGAETGKEAGGANALAPKMETYQQLQIQQQFLQQMLQAAVTSLEAAEATAQQQQLFLARVAEPSLPDAPYYPFRRLVDILTVLISALLVYWIGRMIAGAISDHIE